MNPGMHLIAQPLSSSWIAGVSTPYYWQATELVYTSFMMKHWHCIWYILYACLWYGMAL